jgi:hypothetical protein
MATPKKKTSNNTGSSNAAEKKAAMKKAASNRTDAAGRQGMGETATSNMRFKAGSSLSSANKTANAAAINVIKEGGSKTDMINAYIKSLGGAGRAAYGSKKKMK